MSANVESLATVSVYSSTGSSLLCVLSRVLLTDYLEMAKAKGNFDEEHVQESSGKSDDMCERVPRPCDDEAVAMAAMGLPTAFSGKYGEEYYVMRCEVSPSKTALHRSASANQQQTPPERFDPELEETSSCSHTSCESAESLVDSSNPGAADSSQSAVGVWHSCGSQATIVDKKIVETSEQWLNYWNANGETSIWKSWMEKYGEYVDPNYCHKNPAQQSADDHTNSDASSPIKTTNTVTAQEENTSAFMDSSGIVGVAIEKVGGSVDDVGTANHSTYTSIDNVGGANNGVGGAIGEVGGSLDVGGAAAVKDHILDGESGGVDDEGSGETGSEGPLTWEFLWQQHCQQIYHQLLDDFSQQEQQQQMLVENSDGKSSLQCNEKGDRSPRREIQPSITSTSGRNICKKRYKSTACSVGDVLRQLRQCESTDSVEDPTVDSSAFNGAASPTANSFSDDSTVPVVPADSTVPAVLPDSFAPASCTSTTPLTATSRSASSPLEDSDGHVHQPSSQCGTVDHANGVLQMLGFSGAFAGVNNLDDTAVASLTPATNQSTSFAAKAAHVVFKQKRLKQKTRSLNMIKSSIGVDVSRPESEGDGENGDATVISSGQVSPPTTTTTTTVARDSEMLDCSAAMVDKSSYQLVCNGSVDKEQCLPDEEDGRSRKKRRGMPDYIRREASLRKYWYQRYRLFSRFDEGVQMDREGWFSATPERIARHLALRCCRTGTDCREHRVVVDAFCGVGGNAIQFALAGCFVIAVDIDLSRLEIARHNASIYHVSHLIQFVHADFFHLAPTLWADCVFLSPPWGGPAYCDSPVYDMFVLDGCMDGRRMFSAALSVSNNVCLLCPRNVNTQQLVEFSSQIDGRVEIEQNILNKRVKTVTAYYGDLVRTKDENPPTN